MPKGLKKRPLSKDSLGICEGHGQPFEAVDAGRPYHHKLSGDWIGKNLSGDWIGKPPVVDEEMEEAMHKRTYDLNKDLLDDCYLAVERCYGLSKPFLVFIPQKKSKRTRA